MTLTATLDPDGLGVVLEADFASAVPAPTINRIGNPSNEAGALLAAGTSSTVTQSTTQARSGTNSSRLTRSTGSGTAIGQTPSGASGFPVSGGEALVASCYVRSTAARTVTLGIAFYDEDGASTGSTSTGSGVTTSTSAWTARPVVAVTAPAAARYARLIVTVSSVASTSEFHYCDDFQLERGSAATAYCDGRQTGAAWSGAADASMSYRPAYDEVTVTRLGEAVRGMDGKTAAGGQARGFDGEAPPGVSVTYSATVTNGIATSAASTATVSTPTLPAGKAAIRSLRTPALSVALRITALPEWESGRAVATLYPIGGKYPRTSEGTRRADTGEIVVRTETPQDVAALRALLESDGPYLVQFPADWDEDDVYVSVSTGTRRRLVRFASEPRRNVTLTIAVVDRPPTTGSAVAIPGHTYADSLIAWPTYGDRSGDYGDR